MYGMAGDLDGDLERVVGNHILLAGPLIGSYLKEIGKAVLEKLRSHLTGRLTPPIVTFIPHQIFNYLSTLCVRYGSDIKKNSKQNCIIFRQGQWC